MASINRASNGGEKSPRRSSGGVIKRSPGRLSAEENERPRDLHVPVQRSVVRGVDRRKCKMLRGCLYILTAFAMAGNVFLGCWVFRLKENRGSRGWRFVPSGDHRQGVTPVLRFEPNERFRMLEKGGALDEIRSRHTFGVRSPRLAIVSFQLIISQNVAKKKMPSKL